MHLGLLTQSWPLWSLRYFWWTGGLESGHGEHEIGFYPNHSLQSFVEATAENPHPASCAVLLLDPPQTFFWESEKRNNNGTWRRLENCKESQVTGSYRCTFESGGLSSRRVKPTVRGTVRTGYVSSGFISAARLLAGVYTRLQFRNVTRLPPSVCVYLRSMSCMCGVCVSLYCWTSNQIKRGEGGWGDWAVSAQLRSLYSKVCESVSVCIGGGWLDLELLARRYFT